MRITVHCLVKNEENFIWYAINSVIDYVDEVLVWDMGSSDSTTEIIRFIDLNHFKNKIKMKILKTNDVTKARQKMLEETKSDWIFILDGDEVWWEESIKELVYKLQSYRDKYDTVVIPNYMLIGDIYHHLEEKAGRYNIGNRIGHYNIRAIRKIPGLRVEGIYPKEAYVTREGIKVQNLPEEKILFLNKPYLHASFLRRSSQTKSMQNAVIQFKYEIGEELPADFYYPEVFFRSRPKFVPSPWTPMSGKYRLRAYLETPFKKMKRRII